MGLYVNHIMLAIDKELGLNRRSSNQRRPNRRRNRGQNKRPESPPPKKAPARVTHIPKRYGVVFFQTLEEAKSQADKILDKAKEVDQLNIVIRSEANMDDPELCQYGKVFAGEAWALIHDRRVADGWYNEPR